MKLQSAPAAAATLLAAPIVGAARVIVLAPNIQVIRGTQAEFLHFGISLTVREDILAGLAEVLHDKSTALVIAHELPPVDDA